MAWTAPRTWVALEIIGAALMNTHIRDNQLADYVAQILASGDLAQGNGPHSLARLPVGTPWTMLRARSDGLAVEYGGIGLREPVFAAIGSANMGAAMTDIVVLNRTNTGGLVLLVALTTTVEIKSGAAMYAHATQITSDGTNLLLAGGNGIMGTDAGGLHAAGGIQKTIASWGWITPAAGAHVYKLQAMYTPGSTVGAPTASAFLWHQEFS